MGVPITDENHVTTVTASMSPYSVSLWDRLILLDCTDGPIAVLLPPVVVSIPKRYDFKKIDSTANAATITPNGADTIDGAATRVLSFQWQTFGSTATAVGWTVNYSPMLLAADGESSSVKAPAANDARLSNARTPTAHTHAESDVTNLTTDLAAKVPTSRTVSTTEPLTGGGDLSANRTLAVSDFVGSGASHARGTVPDPGSTAGALKVLREDATWQVVPLPKGYLDGFALTWNSVTVVSVAAGNARDSADSLNIAMTSADTADVTVAGDRDFTPGVNQWIYVHVIADSAGVNATRAFLSLSATAPTLPSGYDKFRRVGVIRAIVASTFLQFNQTGAGRDRYYAYDEGNLTTTVINAGAALVFTAVSCAAFVPPTAWRAHMTVVAQSLSNISTARFRTTGSTRTTPMAFYRIRRIGTNNTTLIIYSAPMDIVLNGAQSMDYIAGSAVDAITVWINGFTDEL